MIFQIFKTYQKFKEGKEIINDPTSAAKSAGLGLIMGYLVSFIITTIIIFAGLGILGFTDWLGGPYQFAKVIFWILFAITFLSFWVILSALKYIKKLIRKQSVEQKNKIHKNNRSQSVIDVDIVD